MLSFSLVLDLLQLLFNLYFDFYINLIGIILIRVVKSLVRINVY
jgi:hypothetical protein